MSIFELFWNFSHFIHNNRIITWGPLFFVHPLYVTIGCSAVDTSKNFDRHGQRSNVIATFPVPTEQSLKGTVTFHKDVHFEAPLSNGCTNVLTFFVNTNLTQPILKLYALIECYLK